MRTLRKIALLALLALTLAPSGGQGALPDAEAEEGAPVIPAFTRPAAPSRSVRAHRKRRAANHARRRSRAHAPKRPASDPEKEARGSDPEREPNSR